MGAGLVSRLGRIRPRGQRFDLAEAFQFLGRGPTNRELGLAADVLRESEVEVDYDDAQVELARANGSSAFVALDLAVVRYSGLEALRRAGPRASR